MLVESQVGSFESGDSAFSEQLLERCFDFFDDLPSSKCWQCLLRFLYFLYFFRIFCCSSADILLDEESEYAGEYSSVFTKLNRISHEGWSFRFQKSVSESIVSFGTVVGVSFLVSGTWKMVIEAGEEWVDEGLLDFGLTFFVEAFDGAVSSKISAFGDLSEPFRFILVAFCADFLADLFFKMLAIVLVEIADCLLIKNKKNLIV